MDVQGWIVALGACLAAVAATVVLVRTGRRAGSLVGILLAVVAFTLLVRPPRARPTPTSWSMPGVRYERRVQDEPRAMIVHVLRVDLDAPHLRFSVTPPERPAPRTQRARTTSQRLGETDGQIAINGAYFSPFHAVGAWDYYPHAGDPVETWGVAMAGGRRFGTPRGGSAVLVMDDEVRILDRLPDDAHGEALTGEWMPEPGTPYGRTPQPRTAVGLDHDGRAMFLVVADGRQPGYSAGITLSELSQLLVDLGAEEAMFLDGGGSSTMVDASRGVLNSPIHTRIPGRERPVGTHLVVSTAPPH